MPVLMQHNDHGGEGPPLLIFHGLFGSARNWTSVAKELTDCAHVYTFDFRNHGDSPHADSHSIQDLSDDILYWITEHKIQKPILLGHSMGGMAVAATALGHPEDIHAAIIVDIAPRHYAPHHQKEFAALKMDVSGYTSRSEIDAAMQSIHPDPMVRQFLQMNLERTDGTYKWKINVPVLEAAVMGAGIGESIPETGAFDRPSLFITGGVSDYVQAEDHSLIMRYFPRADIKTIVGAGHWMHYTHANAFAQIVRRFIAGLE